MTMLKYVVIIIGGVLTLCVVGIILLAMQGSAIPDVLQNIAVGSLTALAGILVNTERFGSVRVDSNAARGTAVTEIRDEDSKP